MRPAPFARFAWRAIIAWRAARSAELEAFRQIAHRHDRSGARHSG
jgi:hypothetical protein